MGGFTRLVLGNALVVTDLATERGQKSRPLSPHDRFVIAFHSLEGVTETGLVKCPAEKVEETPTGTIREALSLVRFESKTR